jgi:Ca2+-binding RTX toxin-like protein
MPHLDLIRVLTHDLNDRIRVSSAARRIYLRGGDGPDDLAGGDGRNVLDGGRGADVLGASLNAWMWRTTRGGSLQSR